MFLRTVHCRIKVECIRLRVKDIDFGQNQIIIRDGKGMKDRVTLLPEQIKLFLREHLEGVPGIRSGVAPTPPPRNFRYIVPILPPVSH